MKIGTFSQKVKNHVLRPPQRIEALLDLVNEHEPDLLLCAGWTLASYNDLRNFAESINGTKTHVVLEAKSDGEKGKDHSLYRVDPNGCIHELASQKFGESREVTPETVTALEQAITSRWFSINGRGIALLSCGEINIVKGRHNPAYASQKIKTLLESADIVLNPTHTRMGNPGTLDEKRKYLSQKVDGRDRIYVSCANMSQKHKVGKPQRITRQKNSGTLHVIYRNGTSEGAQLKEHTDGSNGYVYRQWDGQF